MVAFFRSHRRRMDAALSADWNQPLLLTDSDLCWTCTRREPQLGGSSRCQLSWPGEVDDYDNVVACVAYDRKPVPAQPRAQYGFLFVFVLVMIAGIAAHNQASIPQNTMVVAINAITIVASLLSIGFSIATLPYLRR